MFDILSTLSSHINSCVSCPDIVPLSANAPPTAHVVRVFCPDRRQIGAIAAKPVSEFFTLFSLSQILLPTPLIPFS
jgi:hypothetical protein